MRIVGPDELLFGVDDMEACRTYLVDYGLNAVPLPSGGVRLEAQDGTAITLHPADSAALPPALGTGATLRQTIWGCVDQAAVDAIAAELSTDREVIRLADGSIQTQDDAGFAIAFRVTTRTALDLAAEGVNSPGAAPGRGVNVIGADEEVDVLPRTLSHVVYFTPDQAAMERFYVDRLQFAVVDRFVNVGPFLRPRASDDHHCLFFIEAPAHMQGLEHFAFHVQGPTSLMLAGSRMVAKGYESFWGPGRHRMGSNWFWYFNSPLGVHVEYDADMDKHDDTWTPREMETGAEASQMFLFENVAKWAPGGGPPQH